MCATSASLREGDGMSSQFTCHDGTACGITLVNSGSQQASILLETWGLVCSNGPDVFVVHPVETRLPCELQ